MNESSAPRPRGSTTAQLKADIDSGRTGDKVGGFDPAAAPLGVDEEAGGHSPSPELVEQARRAERGPDTAHANAAEPALAPDARVDRGGLALPILAGAAAALGLGAILAFALS